MIRTIRQCPEPSVSVCRTVRNAQHRDPRLVTCLRLPPALEVLMVTFNVSPLSGVLSATTFLQEFLLFSSAFRASSMMTSLPLPLSAALGQIRTFYSSKSIIFIGKGSLSTCISLNFNRPSLMSNWICRRNTLQSLVA
jgi:hypothetical protein